MENYIINTTVITYLYEINELFLLDNLLTIPEVKEEFKHLRKIIDERVKETKTNNEAIKKDYTQNLSDVDIKLLQTARKQNYILVTDDKKLEKAAKEEGVRTIDTPRLIIALAFEGVILYKKAEELLDSLKYFYNRLHSIKRAMKNLNEWR